MNLFSRKVDYALLILSYLDQHRTGACAREIADRFGISKGFVANILKLLCNKGFVTSHRGVKGGYILQGAPEEITLAELLEAIEEGVYLTECTRPMAGDLCSVSSVCPVKGAIAEVHRRMRDLFRGVTLAEVFRPRPEASRDVLPLGLLALETRLVAQ